MRTRIALACTPAAPVARALALAGLLAGALAPSVARADGDRTGETSGTGETGDRMIDRKLAKAEPASAGDDKRPPGEPAPGTTAMCIDQEIADRLAIKRKRRGAVDRLFVKQGRHELSVGGGYYASDLLSGTYIVGASYTYHMTDETAVEFAGWWTHANADIIRALEDKRGTVVADTYDREIFAESLLVWSPVYGKLRLGGSIVHFDLHAEAGVGVIDSGTSRGAAGVLGFGMKLFMGQAIAFRIDARNRTFRQELLDERFLVNDSAVTASLSLFLPFHN
ncbi:MAG TPA: outer membrane beta-barrel domain-containing protein [Kofleriaceae bacterium]|nr:outer membrane beta-barrel domain-containing protein [Kofleriaceae bacterium]